MTTVAGGTLICEEMDPPGFVVVQIKADGATAVLCPVAAQGEPCERCPYKLGQWNDGKDGRKY